MFPSEEFIYHTFKDIIKYSDRDPGNCKDENHHSANIPTFKRNIEYLPTQVENPAEDFNWKNHSFPYH
jgi:hypothetical protein